MPTPSDELSQKPRYRIGGDKWQAICGFANPPGTEFDLEGWPEPWAEPLNEPARRITAYVQTHRFDAFKPETIRNEIVGGNFLPGVSGDTRRKAASFIPPEKQTDGMPAWRAIVDIQDEIYAEVRRFPGRDIKVGDVVVSLDWPARLNLFSRRDFEPDNLEAEAVEEYFAANRDNPNLLPSPWNWFTRSIVLPELPTPSRAGYPRFAAA